MGLFALYIVHIILKRDISTCPKRLSFDAIFCAFNYTIYYFMEITHPNKKGTCHPSRFAHMHSFKLIHKIKKVLHSSYSKFYLNWKLRQTQKTLPKIFTLINHLMPLNDMSNPFICKNYLWFCV